MFSSEPGHTLLLLEGEKEKPKAKEEEKKKKKTHQKNPCLDNFLPSIMFQKYLE